MRTEIAKVFAVGIIFGAIAGAYLSYSAVRPMSGSDFEERWDSVNARTTTSQGRALEDSFSDAVQRIRFLALGLKTTLALQQPAEWGTHQAFCRNSGFFRQNHSGQTFDLGQ